MSNVKWLANEAKWLLWSPNFRNLWDKWVLEERLFTVVFELICQYSGHWLNNGYHGCNYLLVYNYSLNEYTERRLLSQVAGYNAEYHLDIMLKINFNPRMDKLLHPLYCVGWQSIYVSKRRPWKLVWYLTAHGIGHIMSIRLRGTHCLIDKIMVIPYLCSDYRGETIESSPDTKSEL